MKDRFNGQDGKLDELLNLAREARDWRDKQMTMTMTVTMTLTMTKKAKTMTKVTNIAIVVPVTRPRGPRGTNTTLVRWTKK